MYDILTLQAWYEQFYRRQDPTTGEWVLPGRLFADAYGYNVTFLNFVGATGVAAANILINADADFVLTRIRVAAQLASVQTVSSKPIPQVRMQITDAGSARPFWNSAVAVENFAPANWPNAFLAVPKFLSANTTLSLALTGFAGAAETYTVLDVFFDGVAIKRFS